MLENRSEYFSFGDNNPELANLTAIRVNYSDYKRKYSSNKTVKNSYDERTKTIEVYFTNEEIEIKSNLGNTHIRKSFNFIIKDENGKLFAGMFNAKTLENATKNAKKWCRINNCKFITQVAIDRNIQSYGATEIYTCTL